MEEAQLHAGTHRIRRDGRRSGLVASRTSPKDPKIRAWYRGLSKPAFDPPEAVFPVIWTALYTPIAISGWRVSASLPPVRTKALALWAAQLAGNAESTRLFFGDRCPQRALADVALLESLILSCIAPARKVDPPATVCFVPYAAWVAFATLLNAEIVRLNPEASSAPCVSPRAAFR